MIEYLKDLDVTAATAFRATSVPAEGDIPARAWDLDGLRGRYEHFISFARQLRDTTAAGQVPPMDALIARTRVMDEWRAFPGLDPDLPAELLRPHGRGRRPASCSSGATTCSARWPPGGSGRSSPGTAGAGRASRLSSSELKLSARRSRLGSRRQPGGRHGSLAD